MSVLSDVYSPFVSSERLEIADLEAKLKSANLLFIFRRCKIDMPKQQPRNGFYYFMKDVQEDWKRKGRLVNIKDLVPQAHPLWKELPQEKKEEYNERAKFEKKRRVKFDSFGIPVHVTLEKQIEAEKERLKMVTDIKETMKGLETRERIASHEIYVMSFQCFCKTDDNVYVPAEIGMVRFSVRDGVSSEYQKFIDPGKLPTGYRFTCIEQSELTHGIPFEKFPLSTNNYKGIHDDVKKFIQNSDHVYSYPDEMVQTKKCLEWLQEKSLDSKELSIEVYDLVVLLQELRAVVDDPMAEGIAREVLKKPSYDYIPNIGCKWHDQEDRAKYCALSVIKSFCYLMCDELSEKYEVELIAGAHAPVIMDDVDVLGPDCYKIPLPGSLPREEKVTTNTHKIGIHVGTSAVFPNSEELDVGKFGKSPIVQKTQSFCQKRHIIEEHDESASDDSECNATSSKSEKSISSDNPKRFLGLGRGRKAKMP